MSFRFVRADRLAFRFLSFVRPLENKRLGLFHRHGHRDSNARVAGARTATARPPATADGPKMSTPASITWVEMQMRPGESGSVSSPEPLFAALRWLFKSQQPFCVCIAVATTKTRGEKDYVITAYPTIEFPALLAPNCRQ